MVILSSKTYFQGRDLQGVDAALSYPFYRFTTYYIIYKHNLALANSSCQETFKIDDIIIIYNLLEGELS